MTAFISNRDGGKTDERGHLKFTSDAYVGEVLKGGQVTVSSPLGLSTTVAIGSFRVPYQDFYYTGWTDAPTVVPHNTADPALPRMDIVVGYVDRSVVSSATANNPGALVFKSVAGTPNAVPSAGKPSDVVIQASVGAGNPFIKLAEVTVLAGATQISNPANIVSVAVQATNVDNTVATNSLKNGSVTLEKISTGSDMAWTNWTPTLANMAIGVGGVLTAKYKQIGKNVFFRIAFTFGAGSSIGAAPTFTLPVPSINYALGSTAGLQKLGDGRILKPAVASYDGCMIWASTTTASLRVYNVSATYLTTNNFTSTLPFTWAAGDGFDFIGFYEAA